MKIDITEEPKTDAAHESALDEQAMIDEAIARGTQAAEQAIEQEEADRKQEDRDAVDDLLDTIDDLEKQVAERTQQLDEAQARADEATDKYVRLYASWENFRKRTEIERQAERTRATQSLVSHLIVVLDDIDRALEHGKEYADNPEFAGFLTGFDAVRTKFVDALAKEHVEEINPLGEPFDALMHQAVATVADEEAYDETVHTVFQKGYRMGDYVLRPAMVQITQGGPTRPASAVDEETAQEDESDMVEGDATVDPSQEPAESSSREVDPAAGQAAE